MACGCGWSVEYEQACVRSRDCVWCGFGIVLCPFCSPEWYQTCWSGSLAYSGKRSATSSSPEVNNGLCVVILDYLGSDNHLWINRAYPLDKGGDAIKAHILSDSDIKYIMSCTLMLKRKGFVVHRDYCQEVHFVSLRWEPRWNVSRGGDKCPWRLIILIKKGTRFTWENNILISGHQRRGVKLSTMYLTVWLWRLLRWAKRIWAQEECTGTLQQST